MILWKKQTNYISDFENFLNDMKEKNPKIDDGQRAGRALLWDKEPINLDERARADESRIRQSPYVYQSKH